MNVALLTVPDSTTKHWLNSYLFLTQWFTPQWPQCILPFFLFTLWRHILSFQNRWKTLPVLPRCKQKLCNKCRLHDDGCNKHSWFLVVIGAVRDSCMYCDVEADDNLPDGCENEIRVDVLSSCGFLLTGVDDYCSTGWSVTQRAANAVRGMTLGFCGKIAVYLRPETAFFMGGNKQPWFCATYFQASLHDS